MPTQKSVLEALVEMTKTLLSIAAKECFPSHVLPSSASLLLLVRDLSLDYERARHDDDDDDDTDIDVEGLNTRIYVEAVKAALSRMPKADGG